MQYKGWKCYCYNYSMINYRVTLNIRLFFHTIFVSNYVKALFQEF